MLNMSLGTYEYMKKWVYYLKFCMNVIDTCPLLQSGMTEGNND